MKLEEIFRYISGELSQIHLPVLCLPHEGKFISKWKQGVSYYTKPKKNLHSTQYKKPNYDRRIMSKRVFTHTKK